MKKVEFTLEEIVTNDGVELQGLVAGPKQAKRALIFVHGLTSTFYNNVPRITGVARACVREGIVFYAFNNRGHDEVNKIFPVRKKKSYLAGGWFENFTDCIFDISAMIDYAWRNGARKIFLVGHSTGANKIVYYNAKINDRRVTGYALISPMSDVVTGKMEFKGKFARIVNVAKTISKKNPNALMPPSLLDGLLMSAQRVESLMKAGSIEDVFPYHGWGGTWKSLQSIHKPMFVLVGSKDQYLDRSAEEHISVFKANSRSRALVTKILLGATHNFTEHGDQLGRAIVDWARAL